MSKAYYNEIDPYAAQWLRNLIAAGHIAPGVVDERSIVDVRPDDLAGYGQCHFFAGVGGWALALRAAGWPDDVEIWSGSCPCQPFSGIGKGKGFDDERHLWPVWLPLIRKRRPSKIVGEQVSRGGYGWLDLVASDLQSAGYAFGAVDLEAAAFGAWHFRSRLWFFADANEAGWSDLARVPAAETEADIGRSARLAYRQSDGPVRRPPQPDASWVVDGLHGEGFATGALGNAIDQRPAVAFLRAVMSLPPPSDIEPHHAS